MFLHPVDYGRKAEELLWRKVYYEVIQVIKTNKKVTGHVAVEKCPSLDSIKSKLSLKEPHSRDICLFVTGHNVVPECVRVISPWKSDI